MLPKHACLRAHAPVGAVNIANESPLTITRSARGLTKRTRRPSSHIRLHRRKMEGRI